MLNSPILDVAIGVAFGFLAVSLAAGAVVEAINSALKTRSGTLLKAVKDLVNDPNFEKLAFRLYQHALINPRGPGASVAAGAAPAPVADPAAAPLPPSQADKAAAQKNKPAYIDPKHFAEAFIDVLSRGRTAGKTLQQIAEELKDSPLIAANPQMRDFIDGIVQQAQGDNDEIKTQLASWFDSGMDRVSGAFKRRAQLASFVAALIIALLFNVDALRIAQLVWQQPALVDQLKVPAQPGASASGAAAQSTSTRDQDVFATLKVLDQHLPLGWAPGYFFEVADAKGQWIGICKAPGFWLNVLGWLITAFASLFGAPFWFDTLQSFVRLKGAGPSPQEKKEDRAAAA